MFRRYCRDLTALFVVVVALALAMSGCAGHKQTIQTARAIRDAEPNEPDTSRPSAPAATEAVSEPTAAFAPIMFDFDRYNIRDDQLFVIDQNVRAIKGAPALRIEGYADERGTGDYNLALGQRRADAVRKALSVRGAVADMQAVSYGEEFAAGHDEIGWATDRRVDIKRR